MKPSSLVLLLVIVVAAVVAIYAKKHVEPANNVAYAYSCNDGSKFDLITADDLSAIRLSPGAGATFEEAVLVQSGTSAAYRGPGLGFLGDGESVTLTHSGATIKCQPEPAAGEAPLNWGDPVVDNGAEADAAELASKGLIGRWRSTDDAKYVREFQAGGTVIDSYGTEVESIGTWQVYTAASGKVTPFPLSGSSVYLHVALPDTTSGATLDFRIDRLTPQSLAITYLNRGGTLEFRPAL
ncbi:MAG: hypothetical protein KBC95_02325 [Candidatus Peribacteraceae bacterium]|nr:hypothetical protein [Candidatus Peribacteraceae bacterium]